MLFLKFAKKNKMKVLCLALLLLQLSGCKIENKAYIAPGKLAYDDRVFLQDLTERTWRYFELATRDVPVPCDHVLLNEQGDYKNAPYTSITNIGLYLLAVNAAVDLGYISKEEAVSRYKSVLQILKNAEKSSDGLLYNYYQLGDRIKPADDLYVSSVDSAWLAAGLYSLIHEDDIEVRSDALTLLDAMRFGRFYDQKKGQMRLGYSDKSGENSPYHYGQLISEARIITYLAIARAEVPKEHWYRLYRTLPADWKWQRQEPKGSLITVDGVELFQGYYLAGDKPVVPSWGGSLFEFLMPLLVVPEQELATESMAVNNLNAVYLHKKHCLEKAQYKVWGMSPSSYPAGPGNYQYGEFGVPQIGSKGYEDKGIITPHASVLAIELDTNSVIENLKQLKSLYPAIWTTYGYYDSVNVKTGEVAKVFLTLDQEMIFLALHNYLTNGKTRGRFYQGDLAAKTIPLLKKEVFFIKSGKQ